MTDLPERQTSTTYSYMDEIQYTLVELEKALQNIEMMAQTAKRLGLTELLHSPGTFMQHSHSNLKTLLQSIDLKQLSALIHSPVIRRMLTDPEFQQLFTPDTGKTPGTQPEFRNQTSNEHHKG